MIRPVEIKALHKYKIWIKYSDGVEGDLDLSEFAGKGAFKFWDKGQHFMNVSLGSSGEIQWSDEIDLCPDTLYMKLTKRKPEDIFPNLRKVSVDA